MDQNKRKFLLLLIALVLSGIAPNLFPLVQSGRGELSTMAIRYFIPSALLTLLLLYVSGRMHCDDITRQIRNGILGGVLGTVGLEVVRETGFHLGGMPGNLPQLIGVLLLDRFASGPNIWSDLAGWTYHFWTGAAFGILYSILVGRGRIWMGVLYGVGIGLGFMLSPVPIALGVGRLGLDFKEGYQFLTTVTLAHAAFGSILGWYIHKKNTGITHLPARIRHKRE
jgi:hypothetical protein